MGLLFRASFAPETRPSPTTWSKTTAPPRPAVILPGLGNNSKDYERLATTLEQSYGVGTTVADVSRVDWLRNAAGLLDGNYWRGTLNPRPVLDWYLERVEAAITQARQKQLHQGEQEGKVSLIAHSAGGWLARLYLKESGTSSHVSLLLTLGSPHSPPPKDVPGVIDQTRGLLEHVQKNCTPAVYSPELRYVCVAGRYTRGARIVGQGGEDEPPATLGALIVGQGYKQVCGKADVWGDGVVPEESAHLNGALNLTYDAVYHSPVGSDDKNRLWYGSPLVVDKWIHHLLH